MATRKPLSSRPLDLFYFAFFLIHIPATLLLDCQAVFPTSVIPTLLQPLPRAYIDYSADPLIAGAMGYITGDFTWFKTFLYVEAFFQLPVFVIGALKLWQGSPSIYPLLLMYGASTATAVLPCLAALVKTPITSAETIAAGIHSITPSQQRLLLWSYVPFLLIPLLITVDMAHRLSNLIRPKKFSDKRKVT